MRTITKISTIRCTQDELFEFHTDSNNITKITPPNIKVQLLNNDTTTYQGKVVRIKTTKFFIPTYWEVKIEKLERPNILVDVAQRSPFTHWVHQHIFTDKGDHCELKDIIEFELPFKPLSTLIEPFIEKDIKDMFDYRHARTKELLEN